jgi:nicotinamide/nicotinate riboside kinase
VFYIWFANQDLQNVPLHPVYNMLDPEDARGAIDWPRFRAAVKDFVTMAYSAVKLAGLDRGKSLVEYSYYSAEAQSLNIKVLQQEFGVLSDRMINEWRENFRQIEEEWLSRDVIIRWCIIEGFLLYYDAVRELFFFKSHNMLKLVTNRKL